MILSIQHTGKKMFFLFACGQFFTVQKSFAEDQKLSLDVSVKLAIESATAVLQSKSDLELSGANLLKSYAQFLPNLTTQDSYTYSTGTSYITTGQPSTISGVNSQVALVLSSDLNLFNGFSDYTAFNSSLLQKNSAELTLNHVKQQIALDIVQSFLQIILDKKLTAIASQNLQQSQTRETLLVEQNRLGAKSPADMYLQEAATSAAESTLFTIQNKMATDTLLLQQKLRLNVRNNIELVEPPLPDEEVGAFYNDENQMIEIALAKRTDLQASQASLSAANFDVKNTLSGYMPKLDVVGSAISAGSTLYIQTVNGVNVVPSSQADMGSQLTSQIRYAVALNFTWNIFDKFVTYANEAQASSQAYKAKLATEDLQNQVVQEAQRALGDYKLSLHTLKSTQKGLFAAEKAYQVMTGRYRVGSASIVDLMTAQDTLVQAQSARANALINFQLQIWNIKYVLGDIPVNS